MCDPALLNSPFDILDVQRPKICSGTCFTEAKQPEDWDEEEDGVWEPPRIPNPACKDAPGCGEWKRPTKPNSAYKGKWSPPMIDNPAYKVRRTHTIQITWGSITHLKQ